MKQRVVIAMSGGVDSSVAAVLLKERGYEVIGVYILGWLGDSKFPCPWQKEEADAREVANKLGIPFFTINLSEDYQKNVVDEFLDGYKKGLTPNPDILCNKEIKFKALWQELRQFEADFLATGHYAKMVKAGTPDAAIVLPKDSNKDQTYFLWAISKEMLPKILFPLGDLTKDKVRCIARKYKLPTAAKKDSQGICFIGKLKVRDFLTEYLKEKPGEAILASGKVVAKHKGAHLYTIGQRLAADSVQLQGDVPSLFVIAKDIKRNIVVVGNDRDCFDSEFVATSPNWLTEPIFRKDGRFEVEAKIRYRQISESLVCSLENGEILAKFAHPTRAITIGQSVVFYQKNKLLGGAIISKVKSQEDIIKNIK